MQIAQRGTSFAAAADGTYSVDRFQYFKSIGAVHTVSQDTDAPTQAQSKSLFNKSLRLNLTTPDTSIAAGEYVGIVQAIEGYNYVQFAQKAFTLSFWVKATLTGTYCVAFKNNGNDRTYVAEYTVNATNTWEQKFVTVLAPPSAGTWDYTNGAGLKVIWVIAAGSTFQTSAGSWNTGSFFCTSNQVNGVNTGATDFKITGVMVNEGVVAAPFSLFGNTVEGEIVACQRYYEKSDNIDVQPGSGSSQSRFYTGILNSGGGGAHGPAVFRVVKRNNPSTVSYWNSTTPNQAFWRRPSSDGTNTLTFNNLNQYGFEALNVTTGSAFQLSQLGFAWAVDAEL
jgi:hypothetical protein